MRGPCSSTDHPVAEEVLVTAPFHHKTDRPGQPSLVETRGYAVLSHLREILRVHSYCKRRVLLEYRKRACEIVNPDIQILLIIAEVDSFDGCNSLRILSL